ncbi:hypothetical protein CLV85_0148 [Salinibacterium amurskyense]|uniref:Uncharacterized protein n=1 Tax=Salinibacterium amurskyense TaxID=205941 RepID=A0A2M9D5J0_9MICO|nr:hypothetical protein [Salinibacterium amurskyense]PJJ80981.1 hypothetical protein CLV85_0148 [Salinibacterium amurskyense]RLQ83020.1 hypothetical protein D9C83_00740 [Salinibacterium amurskyense]GHD81892.1 hypothetical protein GCM10007394_16560 [Salinibacterium amurskyense]
MTTYSAMLLLGAYTGMLQVDARKPRSSRPALVGSVLVIAAAAVFIFSFDRTNWIAPFVFFGCLWLSSALYAAWGWTNRFPEAGMSFWAFFVRELYDNSFTAKQYATMLDDRERSEAQSAAAD